MLAAGVPDVGIGFVGVSLAFGLTVLTIAYSLGHISGAHLNPAVTVGLWMGGRISANKIIPYAVSQVLGGIAGEECFMLLLQETVLLLDPLLQMDMEIIRQATMVCLLPS